MKLKGIIQLLKRKIKGSLQVAREDGMIVEEDVTVMGGVNFGSEPYLIHLKKGCRISFDVAFITHDGGTWAFRRVDEKYKNLAKFGKIIVGEESFIGCRSIIMPGVTIGKNCVVGAGSVVTKDVPDETVVCGVPARFICTTHEYAEKSMKMMSKDFDYVEYMKNKKAYLVDYYMKDN